MAHVGVQKFFGIKNVARCGLTRRLCSDSEYVCIEFWPFDGSVSVDKEAGRYTVQVQNTGALPIKIGDPFGPKERFRKFAPRTLSFFAEDRHGSLVEAFGSRKGGYRPSWNPADLFAAQPLQVTVAPYETISASFSLEELIVALLHAQGDHSRYRSDIEFKSLAARLRGNAFRFKIVVSTEYAEFSKRLSVESSWVSL